MNPANQIQEVLTMVARLRIIFIALTLTAICARGQNVLNDGHWQNCAGIQLAAERLACYDQWASAQSGIQSTHAAQPLAKQARTQQPPQAQAETGLRASCRTAGSSVLSRFWELERDNDCGTFGIRGYKPISLALRLADQVNTQPSAPSDGHTALEATAYNTTEARIQLSIRTKIASGMLTGPDSPLRDSLWFGYSQQSNWQVFSSDLSRPFRTTDHEPEITYIYPGDWTLGQGWRLRYSGLSLVHQSNGQSLPLSRSWNRAMLMGGLEHPGGFHLLGKLWYRLPEDLADDDNPDIADRVGRAEFTGIWRADPRNTLSLTVRHSLRSQANGSTRLEWMRRLGDDPNTGLRLHTQLFSGYGDSLVDYNRRRTVLNVGLSLVDW
jgi:phospholipase A1